MTGDFKFLSSGILRYCICFRRTKIYNSIVEEFDIPQDQIFLNIEKNRIEINLDILEEIAPVLIKQGYGCY